MEDGKIFFFFFLASCSSGQMKMQEECGQAHLLRGLGEGGLGLGSLQLGEPPRD